jgi:MoaA/NifB/PqqE/SkfB family radical SAM enzyme
MFRLIPKIFLFRSFYQLGFPRLLPINYTVSLLYSCNSRCKTCNIWKKPAKNLTLSEYKLIFKKIGRKPYWVTLSGGEPFLRNDIVEIAEIIYKYSRPKILNIPTNGIETQKIIEAVFRIAKNSPKTQVIINLSIDGVEDQHDEIRQIEGNYEQAMLTYSKLKKIKLPNLSIGIHSVVSKYNVENFSQVANTMLELKPDSYITEIAEERVELDTIGADITPNQVQYRSAIDYLIHRIKNGKFFGTNKITQAFRIEYYNLVKQIMRDKTQVIPCYAGISSVQISPDGDIWSCCVRAESMGNLREKNYNFKKIWFGKKMAEQRKSIKNKECYCPLANASYTNMLMNFPTLSRVFYRSFIKWWS